MDTNSKQASSLLVLIVDDEADARSVLKSYLADYCPNHHLAGEAANVLEAFRKIRELKPDLLLLDIQMADGEGFDLLDMFSSHPFHVIFTTAHDEFALKAFKYSAVDYLLKPIAPEDFVRALEKAELKHSQDQLFHLMKMMEGKGKKESFDKIALPSQDGLTILSLKEITHLESDGCYTTFYAKDGQRTVVSRSIKEFEELLPDDQFFRVHVSHIVNLDFVKKYLKEDGGYAVLQNGLKIPIARRRKEEFLEMLKERSAF